MNPSTLSASNGAMKPHVSFVSDTLELGESSIIQFSMTDSGVSYHILTTNLQPMSPNLRKFRLTIEEVSSTPSMISQRFSLQTQDNSMSLSPLSASTPSKHPPKSEKSLPITDWFRVRNVPERSHLPNIHPTVHLDDTIETSTVQTSPVKIYTPHSSPRSVNSSLPLDLHAPPPYPYIAYESPHREEKRVGRIKGHAVSQVQPSRALRSNTELSRFDSRGLGFRKHKSQMKRRASNKDSKK